MANGEFEFEGYAELLRSLSNMEDDIQNRVTKNALKKGAEVVRKKMSEEAPRSEEDKRHAADHIIVIPTNLQDKVFIGNDAEGYYLKFVEFGTSSIPANPFGERTARLAKDDAQIEMGKSIKKDLGL